MKIVVGICGSVAAIRIADLIREMVRRGHEINCVMTESARQVVTEEVLNWASENKVITRLTGELEHVKLLGICGSHDTLLICPATSNTISKIACGIDDSTVTTMAQTALGSGKRIVIAPAMHKSMYDNIFVMKNIEKLKDAGIEFIDPRISDNKAKIATANEIIEAVVKS